MSYGVYIYIYKYVCVYTHIVYTRVCSHVTISVWTNARMPVCTYVSMHACMHAWLRHFTLHMYVIVSISIVISAAVCTYIYTYIHTYMRLSGKGSGKQTLPVASTVRLRDITKATFEVSQASSLACAFESRAFSKIWAGLKPSNIRVIMPILKHREVPSAHSAVQGIQETFRKSPASSYTREKGH